MSMLESKSESFLEYIKSLQKGKGKASKGLPRSAPHPSFQEVGQESQAKIPEDAEVAPAPQDEPTDTSFAPAAESAGNWISDHSQTEQKPVHDAVRPDQQAATEEKPQAKGDWSSNTNAPTTSFAQPELQVTTRSMTTTGNNTQAATETSAATEVPAFSRMPSPSPTLPQATNGSEQSTPLLSNGSAFLQALPKAAKAFQPSMRGGDQPADEDHLATPTASSVNGHPIVNETKGGYSAVFTPVNSSDLQSPSSPHSYLPLVVSDAAPGTLANHTSQQDPALPQATKAVINPSTAQQPTFDSNKPWAIRSISNSTGKPRRYTAMELDDIGKKYKQALFDRLVEMEGRGRLFVGIIEPA